ncbi:MAG: transcriptional repressor LexA [Chloroflexota bacterium]
MMARKKSKVLTERQKRVLKVMEDFQVKAGYPPSIREICDQARISSTSVVNYYLEQLEEMGYIERDKQVSRGIRLLKPLTQAAAAVRQAVEGASQAFGEMLQVPMVGRIVAGEPVPVPSSDFGYFDSESMVDVALSMLPSLDRTNDLFALQVQGDSMIDAMVHDGDIVIMKPVSEARNGEMVAVWLNDRDETTLKYFYLEKGRVRLQPANPTMQPIYIEDPNTVRIQGKVVMVIRQLQGRPS